MAAIGLAAAVLLERHGEDVVLGSFAADHVIDGTEAFERTVREGVVAARAGYVVTIGIAATGPSTAFGYVRSGAPLGLDGAPTRHARAAGFTEKPDAETATAYLATGEYRWNAGMFIVRARVLLDHLADPAARRSHAGLQEIAAAWDGPDRAEVLDRVWPGLTKIAIDHAIAEPVAAAGGVAVVPGDFTWDDVGDFDSLAAAPAGRTPSATRALVLRIDADGAFVVPGHRADRVRGRAGRRGGRRHPRRAAGDHAGARAAGQGGGGRAGGRAAARTCSDADTLHRSRPRAARVEAVPRSPVVAPLTSLRPDPTEPMSARLAALVAELRDELVAIRRDIHAHPELGRTEVRTTALVAERLRAAGLEPAPAAGQRPGLRHRSRPGGERAQADRPARRPRRAARAGHQRRAVGVDRPRASRTPAGTTCTPPRCSAPGWRSRRLADELPHRRAAGVPARRGGAARRRARRGRRGRARRRRGDLRVPLRPEGRRRAGRHAHRPDHVGQRRGHRDHLRRRAATRRART